MRYPRDDAPPPPGPATATATGPTVASTLLAYLFERGVRQVFGIVGREALAILFDEHDGLDFVLTRHEFTAGVMADALARLTARPQVCFSTIGPGVTNMTTAVASACLDRSPVIVLSAQVETFHNIPNQTHQCLDNVAIMRPMTKFAAELARPDDIVALLDRAFEASMTEPLGPSFLSLPIDLLRAEVSPEVARTARERTPELTVVESRRADWRQRLDEAVELIEESRHPLITVGTAAVRAGVTEKVRRLSESCEIPVVTAYPAMGVLPHDHPMNYGAITGYMDGVLDYDALEAIFGPVDLLISLGYDYAEDLRPPMWTRGVSKRIIRVASTPNPVPEVFRPDVDVVSPLWDALTQLKESLIGRVRKGGHDIRGLRRRIAEVLADRTEHPGGLLASQVVACVNAVLGDGVFVTDVGLYRHFAVVLSQIDEPNRFLTSDGCATFGFGLPAAMAARMAHPDRPVVLVCGDGGFHSNSQDLETAVRCGLPIVIVLLKNGRNELIRFYQVMGHHQTHAAAVEFGPVDFVALARAQGAEGFHVDRLADLEPAIRRALTLDRPVLIEVPVLYPDLEGRNIRLSEVS